MAKTASNRMPFNVTAARRIVVKSADGGVFVWDAENPNETDLRNDPVAMLKTMTSLAREKIAAGEAGWASVVRWSEQALDGAVSLEQARKIEECINVSGTDEPMFVVFVADCAFPAFFLVGAENESDAEDWFATEKQDFVAIADEDLKDYNQDSLSYNDNGKPVDLESVRIIPVELVRVER